VGFIVNERVRLNSRSFISINERLCTLDLELAADKVRIVGVYMPDTSYADNDVDTVYAQLDEQLYDASTQRRRCIVCGDMNAQVGARDEFDDPGILGPNGSYSRNPRGDWLLQWSTLHDMVVGNTFFETDVDESWTYRNGEVRRHGWIVS
jgi:exonuclease III